MNLRDLLPTPSQTYAPSFILDTFRSFLSLDEDQIPLVGTPDLPIPFFSEEILTSLLKEALSEFKGNTVIIHVSSPVVVVGDVHGNFHDFLRSWNDSVEDPYSNSFLFLGDIVDRGQYQVECIVLLIAMMIQYPQNIFLIRGNHEFYNINATGGFQMEVTQRYSKALWMLFNEVFNYLPLVAIVNNKYFCVHGGLSPHLSSLSELYNMTLPIFDDSNEMISDLVWSDPTLDSSDFLASSRGRGVYFGQLAAFTFLSRNHLERIIRGHESIPSGIKLQLDGKVVTVFTSSGYSNANSLAGILYIDKDGKFTTKTYAPIKYPIRCQASFSLVNPSPTNSSKKHLVSSFICLGASAVNLINSKSTTGIRGNLTWNEGKNKTTNSTSSSQGNQHKCNSIVGNNTAGNSFRKNIAHFILS